jgi:hypothetical protein
MASAVTRTLRLRALAAACVAVLVLIAAGSTARAADIFSKPDYVRGIWLRVGFTTEGRFTFGLSGEAIPWMAGVEVSPGSAVRLVRVFAGARSNDSMAGFAGCNSFLGFGGAIVAGFGPAQPLTAGLRLGLNLRNIPMTNRIGSPSAIFSEGLSYNFSWLANAGHVHDFGLEAGLVDAPHAGCRGD